MILDSDNRSISLLSQSSLDEISIYPPFLSHPKKTKNLTTDFTDYTDCMPRSADAWFSHPRLEVMGCLKWVTQTATHSFNCGSRIRTELVTHDFNRGNAVNEDKNRFNGLQTK